MCPNDQTKWESWIKTDETGKTLQTWLFLAFLICWQKFYQSYIFSVSTLRRFLLESCTFTTTGWSTGMSPHYIHDVHCPIKINPTGTWSWTTSCWTRRATSRLPTLGCARRESGRGRKQRLGYFQEKLANIVTNIFRHFAGLLTTLHRRSFTIRPTEPASIGEWSLQKYCQAQVQVQNSRALTYKIATEIGLLYYF